jgi:hypothetical protein
MNAVLFAYLCFFCLYAFPLYYTSVIKITIKKDFPSASAEYKTLESYLLEEEKKETSPVVIEKHNDVARSKGMDIYHPKPEEEPYAHLHMLGKKILEEEMEGVDGIVSYYRGYSVISDESGDITFPRLDFNRALPIIVTSELVPVVFEKNRLDHFVLLNKDTYALYTANFTVNEEKGVISWRVVREESLGESKGYIVPQEAIIIIGEPQKFFFEPRPLESDYSNTVLLPPLYRVTGEGGLLPSQNFALQTFSYFLPLNEDVYTAEIDGATHEGSRMV